MHSIEAYGIQILDAYNWVNEQIKSQLDNIQKNQHNLNIKLEETLSDLAKAQYNLQTISNGLFNSTSVLLKKQQQLVVLIEGARKTTFTSVIVAWVIPCLALIGWLVIFVLR